MGAYAPADNIYKKFTKNLGVSVPLEATKRVSDSRFFFFSVGVRTHRNKPFNVVGADTNY